MKILLWIVVGMSTLACGCPDGMLADPDHPGRCFKFVNVPQPFTKAEPECQNIGGHLASILDYRENWFISSNAYSYFGGAVDFWIGASKLTTPNGWAWTDETRFNYKNWAPGQPDESKPCASSRVSDALWRSSTCGVAKPFVCLYTDPMAVTTTTMTSQLSCPYSWNYFNQSCYKAVNYGTMDNLEESCVSELAVLTSIHGWEENNFVGGLTRLGRPVDWDGETFLGLVIRTIDNSSFWMDGSQVDFVNWAAGEPSNTGGGEFCVTIITDEPPSGADGNLFKWNDYPCSGSPTRAAVCKKDATIQPKTPPMTDCQPSWNYFSETDSCYKAVYSGTMHDLQQACVAEGATLTSIHSQDENDFVANLTCLVKPVDWSGETFIGLALRGYNEWFWLDGSPANFFNWGAGEPSQTGGGEFCVTLTTDPPPYKDAAYLFKWNDYPCSGMMRAGVCKKKKTY